MTAPLLSVVVIAYNMSRQAMNTLETLTPRYQLGVSDADYEIVVVENDSDDMMDPEQVRALAPNIRYFRRHETGISPAPAVNRGIAECRGEVIGIMVDGARMVTPGVIRNVLDVFRMDPDALAAVIGLHIGPLDHGLVPSGYDEAAEQELLAGLPHEGDGYCLFDISCLSRANPHGVAHPMMESNCMFASRANLERIGGADERFVARGGGMMNLDIYRQLAELPETTLWVFPGEASFHQLHGGTTTQPDRDRALLMAGFQAEYEQIRGRQFRAPTPEPNYYGEVHPKAMPLLRYSAQEGIFRFNRRTELGEPVWQDQVTSPLAAPGLLAELTDRELTAELHERTRMPIAPSELDINPGQPSGPDRAAGAGRLRRSLARLRRIRH